MGRLRHFWVFLEGIQRSWAGSMFDPRTGGVAQQPKGTSENGVNNLNGAFTYPQFQLKSNHVN